MVHAMQNADDLHAAARDQLGAGRHGVARALAIAAREEFGKALHAALHLVGHTPAARLVQVARDHRRKQAMGALAGLLAPVLDPGVAPAAAPRGDAPHSHVAPKVTAFAFDLVTARAESPAEALATVAERARAIDDAVVQAVVDSVPDLTTRLEAVLAGADEGRRQDGLYVSLAWVDGAPAITHPRQVTREAAEAELASLASVLRVRDEVSERWGTHGSDQTPPDTVEASGTDVSGGLGDDVELLVSAFDRIFRPGVLDAAVTPADAAGHAAD